MENFVSTVTVPHAINASYTRTMLRRGLPLLVAMNWAQVRDIPKGSGNVVKWRKYGALPLNTTPLVEGVTPAGKTLSPTDITATVQQYGDYIMLTDWVSMTTFDPLLQETAVLLGEQMGQSLNKLLTTILNAGTSVQRAAGRVARVNITSADVLTKEEVKIAVRTLKNNHARKLLSMVSPDQGYATKPIPATYVGITHTNVAFDLKDTAGFTRVEDYANKANLMEGEIGSMDEVRFVETTEQTVFEGAGASGIDVYSTLIFGADAYGVTRISGEAGKNIIKALGSGGTSDPLDQRATSGWKATFAAVILQQLYMVRIEHAVAE